MTASRTPVRRALVSVYDKTGLEELGRRVPRRELEQAAVIVGPTPLHGAEG